MTHTPQDIWLAGDENIYLISDLLEPLKEPEATPPWHPQGQDPDRRTGRTSKLALQYAQLTLKTPGHRVIILDHYDSKDAHYRLQILVTRILDTMKIDYQTGTIQRAVRDDNEFTGVKYLPDACYVTALPKST